MKTKHNPNIKKLSTAIRRGYQIAKERGIKVARGVTFRKNKESEITCACALGLAAIGRYGLDKAGTMDFSLIIDKFKIRDANRCLNKKVNHTEYFQKYRSVSSTVVELNDEKRKSPEQIANLLESCGL